MPSPDLQGRTFAVTGANAGLGRAITTILRERGGHVAMLCRRVDAGEQAAAEMGDLPGAFTVVHADLLNADSLAAAAHRIAADLPPLDALVNNAGVYLPKHRLTDDGVEATFATNHLGPFRLTRHLLPRLVPGGRVVNVASLSHRHATLDLDDLAWTARPYQGYRAYASSKLCNLLFTRELSARLDRRIPVNAVHPGTIRTEWAQDEPGFLQRLFTVGRMLMPGPRFGARHPVWLATDEGAAELHDAYLTPFWRRTPSQAARDDRLARRLWSLSEALSPGLPPLP